VSAVSAGGPQPVEDTALNGPTSAVFTHIVTEILPETVRVPRLRNYILCAVAGVTWYLQFFFYSMGETKMGIYTFSSWSLHMASIVIFSTLWGLGLHEWRGASRKPMRLLFLALATLIGSTLIIGYGNYLSTPVH
jgi:L-rhamnose-H+ transport protein